MRRPVLLPSFLQRLSTDEFTASQYTSADRRIIQSLGSAVDLADRVGLSRPRYWGSALGTAAGLEAINDEHHHAFYDVPSEAKEDEEAAAEAFAGGMVIDVQTHYVSDNTWNPDLSESLGTVYRALMPDWWSDKEMSSVAEAQFGLAEYLRCVFLETNNAVAVLSSAPFGESFLVDNQEMLAVRLLCERLGGTGRLLNHTVIEPTDPYQLEAMGDWAHKYGTVAWKSYTTGRLVTDDFSELHYEGGWMLDDDTVGNAFLERVREVGVRRVCVHKGLSGIVNTGSPRDVGPAAARFPDIDFLIYHSGYELPLGDGPSEGPYTEETPDVGVNRLVSSLRGSGVQPGANVYAELGTTWFSLIRRPVEAAHVLGKLLLAVGEDNVLWGTDSIWYGPAQPAIDAFRAFQIPVELQQRFGYPALTREIKEKILARNAARVYDLDLARLRDTAANDELAWVRAAADEYRRGVARD